MYGGSAIAHPQGAWQIYQHSGNKTFLEKSYQFYKDLHWDGIYNKHWFYAYDSGRTTNCNLSTQNVFVFFIVKLRVRVRVNVKVKVKVKRQN